ncbi:MAG: SDR family oxidoreductase [Acidimicrobiia bacterium]
MGGLFDLAGKSVLVTGGNNGIGLGIAEAIASAGGSVAIWGRNASRNSAALEKLRAISACRIVAFPIDVANEHEVADGFAATVDELGRVDVVFANAGVGGASTPLVNLEATDWRSVLAVNLDGTFWTFREALRYMQPQQQGSLIAISSVYGDRGFPLGAPYAATKAAVRAVIRSIAVEYGPYGIRANAIAPGWVSTGMTSSFIDGDHFSKHLKPRVPLGRWGRPSDLAGIAIYLASDASIWHTGDTITVDGGFLCS